MTIGVKKWIPPGAASLAALAVGTAALAVRRPWHDELYTLELSRRTFAGIVRALHVDSGPPGYYFLCHLLHIAGFDSVRALRWLSVAAVAAGVALLVAAVAEDRLRAWCVAALLAFHPLLVRAAGEARQYGLLFALAALTVVLLKRYVTRWKAVALAFTLAAACWVHALGLVLAGGVFAVGVTFRAERRKRVWLAVLAALAMHLPWLPVMAGQPAGALAWMSRGWAQIPAWRRVLLPLLEPGPAAAPTPFVQLAFLPGLVAVIGVALWVLLLVTGLSALRRIRAELVLWLAIGGALVGVSLFVRPVYAPGRADVVLLPTAVLVVTAARGHWRRVGVATALLLAILGAWVSARSLVAWAGSSPPASAAAASALERVVRPGDTVVTTGWWLLDVRFRVDPAGDRLRWLTFPAENAGHPGWYADALAVRGSTEIPGLIGRMRAASEAGHEVWLLRSPALPSNRLLDPLVDALGLLPVAKEPPLWELWGRDRSKNRSFRGTLSPATVEPAPL